MKSTGTLSWPRLAAKRSLAALGGFGLAMAGMMLGSESAASAGDFDPTQPRVEEVLDTDGSVWKVLIVPRPLYQPGLYQPPHCYVPPAPVPAEKLKAVPPAPSEKAVPEKQDKGPKEVPAQAQKESDAKAVLFEQTETIALQEKEDKKAKKPAKKDEAKPTKKDEKKPEKKDEAKPAKKDEKKPAKKDEAKPAKKDEKKPAKKDEKKPEKKDEDKPAEPAVEHPYGVEIVPRFSYRTMSPTDACCTGEEGPLHINPQSYAFVYASIPFLRSEYIANPSYRHEATMEILFGQLRPTVVHKHPGQPRPHETLFPFENDIIRPYSYYSLGPGHGYGRGPLPYAAPGAYGVNYNFYYPMPTVYRAY